MNGLSFSEPNAPSGLAIVMDVASSVLLCEPEPPHAATENVMAVAATIAATPFSCRAKLMEASFGCAISSFNNSSTEFPPRHRDMSLSELLSPRRDIKKVTDKSVTLSSQTHHRHVPLHPAIYKRRRDTPYGMSRN